MRQPAETVHGRPAYPGSTSHDTDGQRTGRGQILAITTERASTRSFGMAIKYAGLRGEQVRVIGKNRSTRG
jgi:hypothetical protein